MLTTTTTMMLTSPSRRKVHRQKASGGAAESSLSLLLLLLLLGRLIFPAPPPSPRSRRPWPMTRPPPRRRRITMMRMVLVRRDWLPRGRLRRVSSSDWPKISRIVRKLVWWLTRPPNDGERGVSRQVAFQGFLVVVHDCRYCCYCYCFPWAK